MTTEASWEPVLATLDHYRALLLGRVADQLTYTVPMLGVPPTAEDPIAHHQRQMYLCVERLHDGLQAARLNEQLLVHEFEWASDALTRWGVTAEHLDELIDRYVSTALAIGSWRPAERAVLEAIRAYLREIARRCFPADEGTGPSP